MKVGNKVLVLLVLGLILFGLSYFLDLTQTRSLVYFLKNNYIYLIDPTSKVEEKLTTKPIIANIEEQIPFYEISPDKKFAYVVEQKGNQDLYLKRFHLNQEQVDNFGIVGNRNPIFEDRRVGWITHLSPSGKRILIESWPGHLGERIETAWDLDETARKILDVSELKFSLDQSLIFKNWLSDEEFIIQVYDPPKSIIYKVNIGNKLAQKLFELEDSRFTFNRQTNEIIAAVLEGDTYHVKIFNPNGVQKADIYQRKKVHPSSGLPIITGNFIPNSDSILLEVAAGTSSPSSLAGLEYKIINRKTGKIQDLPLSLTSPIREFSPDFTKGLVSESVGGSPTVCQTRSYNIYTGESEILIKDGCEELKWLP